MTVNTSELLDLPSGSSSNPLVKPYPFVLHPLPTPQISPKDTVAGLRRALSGKGNGAEVWGREDPEFRSGVIIFNGAIKPQAFALVKPRNALDVSQTIKFAREHDLELSVKAGGTGVHGWSIAGHIILDVILLDEVSIGLPSEGRSLYETFQVIDAGPARPSLAVPRDGSFSSKRSASEAMDGSGSGDVDGDADGSRGKRRLDLSDIDEGITERSQSRGSGDVSMSGSNFSTDGGSGEPSRTGSADGLRSSTTPATSATSASGHESKGSMPDGEAVISSSVPTQSLGGSGSSSSSSNRGRMTYVNPSPTTTSAFPFIPTSFGAGSSSSTSYLSSSFLPESRLVLNTNPDPPPYALVTFGAGVRSKQLDNITATSPYGAFHIPTSAFPVGSGQFLLGGFGFMGRKYGLAMDNLVEAEVVLADGRVVWVGEGGKHEGDWKDGENPEELWWGIRGAGPVLGVVTRFRAKAYYVPSVFAGNFIYLFDKETTPSLLRHVRDCIKGSPRSLYANIIMTAGPPGAPAIVVIQLCFSGRRAEGETYVQAIGSWEGGRCLFQDFSERTFERQQLAVEEILKGGQGRKWFIKSDMLQSLTDEVIDETCGRFHEVPDGCTWLFEFTGGSAMADVKDSVFPTSHREAMFTVAALHQWGHDEPPVEDTRCVTTADYWINEVIHANSPGGPLPCFLQSATEQSVASVFGDNYGRLVRLKNQLDPTHFFKHAMWPPNRAQEGSSQPQDGMELDEQGELHSVPSALNGKEVPPRRSDTPRTVEGVVLAALADGPGKDIVEREDMRQLGEIEKTIATEGVKSAGQVLKAVAKERGESLGQP